MEPHLLVDRFKDTGKQTLGRMQYVDANGIILFDCVTLELPWKNNKNKISCIPVGEYDCEKVEKSENIGYPHIWITKVKGRDGIKIHIANYYTQILGCIAVGAEHLDINKDGEKDVTASKTTFAHLMNVVPNKFKLIIK
jgi:hypothetical protein